MRTSKTPHATAVEAIANRCGYANPWPSHIQAEPQGEGSRFCPVWWTNRIPHVLPLYQSRQHRRPTSCISSWSSRSQANHLGHGAVVPSPAQSRAVAIAEGSGLTDEVFGLLAPCPERDRCRSARTTRHAQERSTSRRSGEPTPTEVSPHRHSPSRAPRSASLRRGVAERARRDRHTLGVQSPSVLLLSFDPSPSPLLLIAPRHAGGRPVQDGGPVCCEIGPPNGLRRRVNRCEGRLQWPSRSRQSPLLSSPASS